MHRIKAVIFDMDGVLVDAKDWHYEALNRALNLYGYNISRKDHLSTYDGLPTRVKLNMLTQRYGLPENLHSVINNLKQMYTQDLVEAYCTETPQHIDALKQLKAEGYKLAVASNSVRKSVELMMEKTGLAPYLDSMLSNEDVARPKPFPDIYTQAMKLLAVSPQETLVLEDNPNGIQAAKASGAHVFIIDTILDVSYANILDHIRFYEKDTKKLEAVL